ncbi:myopalladin isoform X2 [Osmerus eperlanus]|uniref:myopalladin isoform X2 n=1 Tax=Osmerus eperlanus TaxID=29151 RepID=UPI002E15369E
MAHIQGVQKKTSTMSLTISSCREISSSSSSSSSSAATILQQRQSTLVQPLCISPQRTQSPSYSQQYTGSGGVAPTFVKCLHDVTTVKGQLVVLECRIRGTPPLQVLWYREDEQILDSADFRILRKKASSVSVPEELCTLVITEAFPEDSGMFKCMALNQYGTVSCSALLEVYMDLEEQLENECPPPQQAPHPVQQPYNPPYDLPYNPPYDPPYDPPYQPPYLPPYQQQPPPLQQTPPLLHQQPPRQEQESSPSLLCDTSAIPPPEWPDSPLEDSCFPLEEDFPDSQPASQSADEAFGPSEESALSSEGQRSPELARTPTPPPPPPSASTPPQPATARQPTPKLFTPSRPCLPSGGESIGGSMSRTDLPTFSPSLYPPTAFNYARPRHFIQSQPQFQAPSYESAQALPQAPPQNQTQNHPQVPIQPLAQPQVPPQANGNSKVSPSSSSLSSPISSTPAPTFPSTSPPYTSPPSTSQPSSAPPDSPSRGPMRSTITLIPRVPSVGAGSATISTQPERPSPAAYLCSVLPSQSKLSPTLPFPQPPSPTRSHLSPPSPLPRRSDPPSMTGLSLNPPSQAPLSPMAPRISPCLPMAAPLPQQNMPPPSCVSLPSSYRASPNILPKPVLRKAVAPRPVSRSTDEQIQGSKDALIQDLENKLRCKEARRRNSQPDLPEGRHSGGLWGKRHSGKDGNEGSAIQEKCYAPRFLQVPQDLTVEEGRFCRIDFKVGGLPTPDVCWYLDGKAIRPDDYHKMLVCEKSMHSFIIEIVTVHHAGVYECVARNRAGESRFTMKLDVLAQEVLRPPTFIQKMLNQRALEGDTVRLECKVDASPPPQLHWKKDKDMLRIDPNRMSLYQDGSGRQCLLLERVEKVDAGWYTLSAINEAGMSTCNARLDVGTRVNKPAPAGKKLKQLSHLPILTVESPPQHTAPLYESEEL